VAGGGKPVDEIDLALLRVDHLARNALRLKNRIYKPLQGQRGAGLEQVAPWRVLGQGAHDGVGQSADEALSILLAHVELHRHVYEGELLLRVMVHDRYAGHALEAAVRAGNEVYAPADQSLLGGRVDRSEEHTSELQSRENLVCRLL